MKKVTILGFGGTIAMVPNRAGVLAPAKSIDQLLTYVPNLSKLAKVEVTQLENLDSTNVNPLHWTKLAEAIKTAAARSDAVIVTHGTDTMAYTASAAALALGRGLSVPVIFTGSQLPIADPGNDARFNLENSMKVALQAITEDIAEVMIVFSDRVLRAARSIKTSEAKFDAFDSPAFPHLAEITATGVTFSPLALRKARGSKSRGLSATFNSRIFTIDLTPGLDPQILLTLIRSQYAEAILLKSLGAGNVPFEEPYSLLPAIEEAVAANIPVLISTKFIGGKVLPDIYESGIKAIEAGAIPAGDMTDVMAQVKLMWLLARGRTSAAELQKKLLRSYVGEVS